MPGEAIHGLLNTLRNLSWHRPDLIESYAKEVLKLEPEHPEAMYYLVCSYSTMQNFPLLLENCRTALRLFPEEIWPYLHLGHYYFYHCQADCYYYALQVYKHVLRICPFGRLAERAVRQIAEIYLINWEPEKSASWLEHALKFNPTEAEYLSRYALAQLRCRNPKLAVNLAEKALSQDPGDKDNMTNCAMVFLYSGSLDQAEELCRSALAEKPDYVYFQRQLTNCLREKEDRSRRQRQGLRYTPLYLRQRGTQKHFDEESRVIKINPEMKNASTEDIISPWDFFPDWNLPNRPAEFVETASFPSRKKAPVGH